MMQATPALINQYYELLNKLLEEMQQLINKKTDLMDIDNVDINQLDEYIQTLNSFYYQSFHQRFFPEYRKILNSDINYLLNLKTDENEIKANIAKLYKGAARCHNHIKEALAQLALISRLAQNEFIYLKQKSSLTKHRFINLLQSAQEQLDKLQALTVQQETWYKSAPLIGIFHQHPDHISLMYALPALDLTNKSHSRLLNNLMVNLQVYLELLENYRHSPEANLPAYWQRLLAFRRETLEAASKKMPPQFKDWYNKYLLRYIDNHLDIIGAHSETKKAKLINQATGELAEWIDSLVKILQTILKLSLESDLYDNLFFQVFGSAEKALSQLNDFCKTTDLSKFLKDLDPQADLNIDEPLLQPLKNILEPAQDFLREYLRDKKLGLKSSLLREIYELQYRLNALELFQAEIEHHIFHNGVMIHWENFWAAVNRFKETLTGLKIDLEKLLAPRNAARQFKNAKVHIEHYILEKGQPFPRNYNYLLESEINEEQEAVVLSARGDLFIIRVDDLVEIELPEVKTALKES